MSSLAERIAQLTPEQRKLIALRRQKKALIEDQENAIIALPGDGPWPASVDQTAIWFIHKLNPDGKGYNISSCTRMQGPLDPAILQRAFDHIVARHEILRTSFSEVKGKPYQVVHEHMPTPITHNDVSHLPADRWVAAARAEIANFVTPFNLETGPLVRMHLIKLADEDHVLQAMFDHTTIDWWSFQIFFHELWVGYVAEMDGKAPELPPMPIQFRDYAVHRNKWLESDDFQRSLQFWRNKLEGAPTLLDLPTDRPRPATPNYRGAVQRFKIPLETVEQLRQVASKVNCSSLMSLLAVTFSFLARYTNSRDLLIGTTITNRDRPETHLMMGYLLNILIMRGRLEDNPNFMQLMEQVRSTVLEGFDHKEVPFRKLVEELNPERDLSRMPMYQVEFIYVTTGGPTIAHQKSSDLLAVPTPFSHVNFEYDRETSAIDLQIAFSEHPDGMDLMIEYMTDLFQAETVRRMGHLITQLMAGMLADPEKPIFDIPMLTSEDRQQILVDWNQTETAWPDVATTPQLIQQQAIARPHEEAVLAGGTSLTYAALMQRAGSVAAGLIARGVGAETTIGVHLNRGEDLLPVLLGIWRAGAAYVPLDPSHPEDRLAYIARDAQVDLILVEADHQRPFAKPTVTHRELTEGVSPLDMVFAPDPLTAAYLIYTSGSTGRPKGVTVSHGALANFLKTMAQKPGFHAGDRLLAVTTLAFDIAGLELYLPLTCGGTVVLAESATSGDGQLLATALETEKIDIMQATPATWRLLYASGWQGRRAMRILCGGEALPEDLARMLVKDCGQLWNLYGPTETTIWSARTPVRVGEPIHLGHPIANTQCYVVSRRLELHPAGVPGELLIGGDGLARGYWQKPGLTAERFIPNPFSTAPGGRLYRTGDLVKNRPNGALLFLGRIDFQVKIRGYRIELDEIANVLAQHDHVDEAVVTAYEGPAGPQLAAYYLGDTQLEAAALRDFVSKNLPNYMVPSFFIALEAWPLTANNKINRRALPKPDASTQQAEYVAPETPMEKALVTIWEEVLGAERVGIHDSFFLLGGHSLLATQVTARVRDNLGRDLPLKLIFDQPTIAALAAYLETAQDKAKRPAMKLVPRGQQYPLSFSQERMWFLDRLDPNDALYNIPFPLNLSGNLNIVVLEKALQALVKRHESLRTRFLNLPEGPVQVIAPHVDLDLVQVDLQPLIREHGEDVLHEHMTKEATTPFDIEKGPVLRAHLYQTGEKRHHLLLVMHHIVSDGWSLGVLLRELATLYRAFAQNQDSPLNELRLQFVDYAVWQQKWLQAEQLYDVMQFWRDTLADPPESIALPYDFPRPPVQTNQGSVHDVWLDESQAEAVESLSRRYGVTPFMTLLAAYSALLHRYSSQTDFCIGTPVANREDADLESMVGLFINTLVLRLNLTGKPSFAELLGRVRDITLEAYSHQEAPFEKVVEALVPERNTSMSPLFQTFFSLETLGLEASGRQSFPGLDMQVMDIAVHNAKFDLSLYAVLTLGKLRLNFEYNTQLFEPETIGRFANHFAQLLRDMSAQPEMPINDIPLLQNDELEHIVYGCNETAKPYPRNQTLAELFHAQVEKTPAAQAVVGGETTWSFQQLNTVANQYAAQLQQAGVGYQDVVGFAQPSSPETIAIILAIVKLGAIYLPIDPDYPPARMAFMLEDARAVLRTGDVLRELDSEIPFWQPEPVHPDGESTNPTVAGHPMQAAYIIYTSGSTGKPKGVVIDQRNITSLILENTFTHLTPDEVLLQIASLAFDAATLEIWGSLLTGASMVIHSPKALDQLGTVIKENGISIIHLTPQLFNLVLDEYPETFEGLRQVMSGGEAHSEDHVTRFLERFPECRLTNGYGPTEATTFATTADLNQTGLTPNSVPIGTPIANSTCFVLDRYLRPLPYGAYGELYLGGEGLASCYLGRPRLSATAFIPNPFAGKDSPGDRLYKTGDRVRLLKNDLLEFGNRFDRQVKLRGFRLELGEIENCLNSLDSVKASAIRFDADQQRLIAYVAGPDATEHEALCNQLQEQLPVYMIPSAWAFLPALPLTTNGKVDWRELIQTPLDTEKSQGFKPPETDTEKAVAQIWATLLNREQVGKDDNFFSLGGHSLLATRAMTRLRLHFGMEVPLQAIFQYPSLCDFSRFIEIGLMDLQESSDDDEDMEEGEI